MAGATVARARARAVHFPLHAVAVGGCRRGRSSSAASDSWKCRFRNATHSPNLDAVGPRDWSCAVFRGFPTNQWYVAAYGTEVGRNFLARTICGEPIVFYRTQEGAAVALADRCVHRRFPLSQSRLDGDDV